MRVKIALFFTLLFSLLLITPTVISLVNNPQNAFLLNITEKEENKGKEGKKCAKDIEIKIYARDSFSDFLLNGIKRKKNVSFKSTNYTSEFPQNTTPPPKLLS